MTFGRVAAPHIMIDFGKFACKLKSKHNAAVSRRFPARVLLRYAALPSQRAQGRPGAGWHPRSAARKCSAKEPHSSIQVSPITRPSLRSGLTAYAVPSREPNSFWPPSPSRKSPAPRRLTRLPHPRKLDRSNDGQDHTVLPYAHSAARPHDASGSRRAIRPARTSRTRRCRVHRNPARVSNDSRTAPLP